MRRRRDRPPAMRWLTIVRSPLASGLFVITVVIVGVPLLAHRAAASRSATPIDAQQIYLQDCATCHGADAHGTRYGPTLEGQGAAGVDFMVSTGRMPLRSADEQMERHPARYPAETIAALVAYVARLVPGGPSVPAIAGGDVAQGGSIYRQQCAACHQAAGEGGALLGQDESPSLAASTPVQVAEAIRTGPGTMPVFGPQAIPDGDVASLTRYVTVLQDPVDAGGQPLWHLGPMPEGAVAIAALALIIGGLRWIGSRT
ncbi:MAG: menaquinol-cytochrome c reductase cytochrome c1 subunit precursor [Acidimicrobiales bacterium]|nr:menaquinol-cytochrome c reductase cytochrome c1 subunit precursor [Acidimicrobiales bacterium]